MNENKKYHITDKGGGFWAVRLPRGVGLILRYYYGDSVQYVVRVRCWNGKEHSARVSMFESAEQFLDELVGDKE